MSIHSVLADAGLAGDHVRSSDFSAITVGMNFFVTGDHDTWTIDGVRIWIDAAETADLTGAWGFLFLSIPNSPTLVASKQFPAALTPGQWNSVNFDTPVTVQAYPTAGTYYIAAVYLPHGGYVHNPGAFTPSGGIVSPTTANLIGAYNGDFSSTDPIPGNGVFHTGTIAVPASASIPTWSSFSSNSYGVDVLVNDQVGAPPAAPVNTVAPAVTPSSVVAGNLLSCSTGAWTGTATIAYTYQWQRDGTNITGATGSAYLTVAANDQGHAIRCVVTATNSVGSASANSNAVTPTTPPPPPSSKKNELAVLVGGAWIGLKLAANVDNNEFALDDYDDGLDTPAAFRQLMSDAIADATNRSTFHSKILLSSRGYVMQSNPIQNSDSYGWVPIPPQSESGIKMVIDFVGGSEDSGDWNHWQQGTPQKAGCYIECPHTYASPDATFGPPAVIAGPRLASHFTAAGMASGWSNMLVTWKGIKIVAPFDSGIVGLDLNHIAQAAIHNYGFHVEQTRAYLSTHRPTNDQTIGLLLPAIGNNDYVHIGSIACYGPYWGTNVVDHMTMERGGFIFCKKAMYLQGFGGPNHGAFLGNLSVEACETVLDATAGSSGAKFPIFIGMVNTELEWYDVVGQATADFMDTNNVLRGQVYWTEDTSLAPTKIGGTHLTITDLFSV